jgi:DNA mismatch endonuclease, patch repair protein
MVDIYSKMKRSKIMSSVENKKTKPEIYISNLLLKLHYRFQNNVVTLPGKPDMVFPRRKKVIFVNGCFWHGHKDCSRTKLPVTNRAFWEKKISGNIQRDKKVRRELNKLGWKTLTIWQCQISKRKEQALEKRLLMFLES